MPRKLLLLFLITTFGLSSCLRTYAQGWRSSQQNSLDQKTAALVTKCGELRSEINSVLMDALDEQDRARRRNQTFRENDLELQT
jgi:hypothetical protein